MEWSKDDLNSLKTIAKKDKTAAEITVLFNEMSTTMASITTTRTIDGIRAGCIELGLPYGVMKKSKSTKKARKRSTKKVRRGDATVMASGGDASSTSHQTLVDMSLSPSGYVICSMRL